MKKQEQTRNYAVLNVELNSKEQPYPNYDDKAQTHPRPKLTVIGADLRPDNKYDPAQLLKGMNAEKEHTEDPEVAKVICKDHLDSDPLYYEKAEKAGL
jgi:hypothetical protein